MWYILRRKIGMSTCFLFSLFLWNLKPFAFKAKAFVRFESDLTFKLNWCIFSELYGAVATYVCLGPFCLAISSYGDVLEQKKRYMSQMFIKLEVDKSYSSICTLCLGSRARLSKALPTNSKTVQRGTSEGKTKRRIMSNKIKWANLIWV